MKFHSLFMLHLLAVSTHAHANNAVTELEYRSAFDGYQAYSEPEIQSWPQMIKRVEEIGGWRVYAREPHVQASDGKPVDSKKDEGHPYDFSRGGAQ
jgi:hypothetical protein